MTQLVTLTGKRRDVLTVTVIAGFGINRIVGYRSWRGSIVASLWAAVRDLLSSRIDWELLEHGLLKVWWNIVTRVTGVWCFRFCKMCLLFSLFGVALEGGCSSAGACWPLFARLVVWPPAVLVHMSKCLKRLFPWMYCESFWLEASAKWVWCTGWAHSHYKKKKHIPDLTNCLTFIWRYVE